MTDLVTRLRNEAAPLEDPDLNDEAADEIERLRAAAVMARTALSDLIDSGDPKVYSDALNALDAALRD